MARPKGSVPPFGQFRIEIQNAGGFPCRIKASEQRIQAFFALPDARILGLACFRLILVALLMGYSQRFNDFSPLPSLPNRVTAITPSLLGSTSRRFSTEKEVFISQSNPSRQRLFGIGFNSDQNLADVHINHIQPGSFFVVPDSSTVK
jgi:hypothetical protein